MLIKELQIPKNTQTYADTLIAVGLTKLLSVWPKQNAVRILDQGWYYQITLSSTLDTAQAQHVPLTPIYPYILFKATDPKPRTPTRIIDYTHEKQIEETYRNFLDATKDRQGKKAARETESPPPAPRADMQLLKDFNSLRMSSPAYGKLYLALEGISTELPLLLLNRLANYLPTGVAADWPRVPEPKLPAANLQLFSPVSGKGVHRPKADSTSPSGLNTGLVDWFEEWMKYIAMHEILSSHRAGGDTIVLAIDPKDISQVDLRRIRQDLLKKNLWGNVKVEINAVLSIATSLVTNSELAKGGSIRLRGKKPNQIVKGIYTSYFKSLGTGKALMNTAFLGIPGWFPIENRQDANDWLGILEEHSRYIMGLDESKPDQIELLMSYRDFIASGRLRDLLIFMVNYGELTMRRLGERKWIQQHTTKNLRRLLMSYQLRSIVDNPGFLNIAAAIRRSTVSAQYRKAKSGKQVFDIKYGLAQEWKRTLGFKDQFVTALADFVQQYNNENARHVEQDKETRTRLTTLDLDQVIDLVEQYGAELVGMLLLAYGYAKEVLEEQEEEVKS